MKNIFSRASSLAHGIRNFIITNITNKRLLTVRFSNWTLVGLAVIIVASMGVLLRAQNYSRGVQQNTLVAKEPTNSGSIPFTTANGPLNVNNELLNWNDSQRRLWIGPRTGFAMNINAYLAVGVHNFSALNPTPPALTDTPQLLQGAIQDSSTISWTATYGVVSSKNTNGIRNYTVGVEGDSYQEGAGTTLKLIGITGLADVEEGFVESAIGIGGSTASTGALAHIGGGIATNLIGISIPPNAMDGGALTNSYGLRIEDQNIAGVNNWAIKTETGVVQFGDLVKLDPIADPPCIGGTWFIWNSAASGKLRKCENGVASDL